MDHHVFSFSRKFLPKGQVDIEHDMGTEDLIVAVYDHEGEQITEVSVKIVGPNLVRLGFDDEELDRTKECRVVVLAGIPNV